MDMSSHMSCQHMDAMAMQERDDNFLRYVQQFKRDNTRRPDDRIKSEYVHKRMCVSNDKNQKGSWETQFTVQQGKLRFDIQTKNR